MFDPKRNFMSWVHHILQAVSPFVPVSFSQSAGHLLDGPPHPPCSPLTCSPTIWWRPALHCTHCSGCILNVMLQLYLIVHSCGKLPCHRFRFSYSISFDVKALISDGCAECDLHEWSPSLAVARGWPQRVLAPAFCLVLSLWASRTEVLWWSVAAVQWAEPGSFVVWKNCVRHNTWVKRDCVAFSELDEKINSTYST